MFVCPTTFLEMTLPKSRTSRKASSLLLVAVGLACLLSCSACPEPSPCECVHTEVFCSRAHLSDFPRGLDNSTTFLDVGHNNITAIEEDTFLNLGLVELVVIVADNNSIAEVSPNAFRGLPYLKFLHLAGNKLTSLPKDVFHNNSQIHHLDLTGNALILPSDGPFLTAPSLEYLDLDHCYLTVLSDLAFIDLPKLRYVNLNNNSLKHLSGSIFQKQKYLRYFKLGGNPFHCNCDLKPLWIWLGQNHLKVEATCDSPPAEHGKALSTLRNMTCN